MKAAYLVKYGSADSAFEIREVETPQPQADQILIRVSGFGLNFADVMARLGLYKGAPPIPTVIGYDVVGVVEACGAGVDHVSKGDRVMALTRFGGYAEYAIAEKEVTVKIPDALAPGEAVALATQYCTAYYLACRMANIQEGEKVLIHAAAGGVGTALTQIAIDKKCTVFGTCSSSKKIAYLKGNGVHHPINYLTSDFESSVRSIAGDDGIDVVFDPVGGKSVKKGFRLLGSGGRILTFGASSMNKTKSIFGKIKVLGQFGIYHPVQFLSNSKGMIGVNMLKVAEDRPDKIGGVMREVVQGYHDGILKPHVGGEFHIDQLAEAHQFLQSRKSMGKVVVLW
ncbi:MAG: zinc-binding dehydrogenase [Bacteroidia bacterium]|nr:zinc-binding dehydrogenase [Bacteroidia bacterium]